MKQPLDLKLLEKVMKLLKKYQVEEFANEDFTLKAPVKEKKARKPYTKKTDKLKSEKESDQDFLDNHIFQPLDNEPWNNIPDSIIEQYTVNGKHV